MYLGIDPGHHGALAFLAPTGEAWAYGMPVERVEKVTVTNTEVDAAEVCRLLRLHRPVKAVVEDVNEMGGGQQGMFTFGMGKGVLKGALVACGIPILWVPPKRWKDDLMVAADKMLAKRRGHMLFPGLEKLLKSEAKSEAAMIALWGLLNDDQLIPPKWCEGDHGSLRPIG